MAVQPFVGEIRLFAGTFAPRGFALCNGQLMPISQNTALFSIIGTSYGGNGTTNFALPNLQSRVPIGMGQGVGLSPYVLGQTGGGESVTLETNNLPAHTHGFTIPASTNPGNTATPGPTWVPARSTGKDGIYTNAGVNTNLQGGSTSSVGNNTPLPILPPFLALTYIIALFGIFPARN